MTSDYENYAENLAFDPAGLNPCNDGKRESDVLLEALAKCEKLQKKLSIAIDALESIISYPQINNEDEIEDLKEIVREIKE